MDADTRHQLKQNELAEALGKLREFGDERTRYWLLALALVLVVVVAFRLWRSMSDQSLTNHWTEVYAVDISADPAAAAAKLRGLVDSVGDPTLSATARIRLAQALRTQASEEGADESALLEQASAAVRPVAEASGAEPEIQAAGIFMYASLRESLRDFDGARKSYERLTGSSAFADSPFQSMAEDRLATIDKVAQVIEFEEGNSPRPANDAAMDPFRGSLPPGVRPPMPAQGGEGSPIQIRPSGPPPGYEGGPPTGQPAPGAGAAPGNTGSSETPAGGEPGSEPGQSPTNAEPAQTPTNRAPSEPAGGEPASGSAEPAGGGEPAANEPGTS